MQKRLALVAALVGSAAFVPPVTLAKAPPPLPTCTSTLAAAVAGIVPKTLPGYIVSGTLVTSIIPAVPENPGGTAGTPTPIGATPAYCQVAFTYSSGLSGPKDGY